MDPRFSSHNAHLENPALFETLDPQLRKLKNQKYIYVSPLLESLPVSIPGIYTLGGGRQVGKTTLLKQWMEFLLEKKNVPPQSIAFFSGELISDYHALYSLLQNQLEEMPKDFINYIILDEVTYIKDWDKAVKFAADSGLLENTILMLTGSDLVLIQEARMRFPGRRGAAGTVDFHLYPLSFREAFKLIRPDVNLDSNPLDIIFQEFQNYLIYGGYLTAINDFASHNSISRANLATYSDWIRGDVVKSGKQEHYLKEILAAIIKRYCTQITWNSLAKDLSIEHPKTISDYLALLESMDAIFIQHALLEDKLTAAPKKAKKVIFTDPFIYHAIKSWLVPVDDPYQQQIVKGLQDPEISSTLVEACAISHYRRYFPTYYIKAEGEVDIAYIENNKFFPIEIKWTTQIRAKDLKQIAKYKQGLILTKSKQNGNINHIQSIPLPLALLQLGA
jgi:predicted AAA+ superfamily ATPase